MNTLVQGYDFQFSNHVFGYNDFPDSPPVNVLTNGPSPVDESSSSEGESLQETDYSDEVLKFISQMLMEEEDLENKPCMLHDCLALQATEKSLYDVLNNHEQNAQSPNLDFTSETSSDITTLVNPSEVYYLQPGLVQEISSSRAKKNRYREDGDSIEAQRSNKQMASNVAESEPLEMYDEVLLCPNTDNPLCDDIIEKKETKKSSEKKGSNRGRPRGSKKQGMVKEVVDLRSLLMQCAQAVASYDSRAVSALLLRIRQHSSPLGDGAERMAHYFANALEARLAGTGRASYVAFSSRISAAEILRGYQTFIKACPFRKISNILANKTIKKLAKGASTLHIIDFGILYGFQWPCLIQALSGRPGGPPKLRITGIDFPQAGFRPAERVEDSGRRLAKYCERFGVPFEYNAIAQKWDNVKLEQLKIDKKNELVVVNSLYRFQNVLDETVMVNSPRDSVLSFIKKINPDMFIHGVVNGTYNTPFFITRFREALFHFSSFFDMYEDTLPREDQTRLLFEEEVFGKDAMNIIACEGTERIDRPETYKQWHVRNVRAGFKQLHLDQQLVTYVRNKVKMEYHKDFCVDEDGKWLLQGWKGRVLHAISCWKPAHN
ncbi:hypothetical protein ACS0TY_008158 [Phlomoides rotata]